MIRGGGDEVDEQPSVVELAVVINNAAGQAVGVDIGQFRERFLLGNGVRFAKAVFAGEQFIHFEADAIKRPLPPSVTRHDAGEFMHEMRRVVAQASALLQRLHHEQKYFLLKITHAAMD